MQLALIVLAGIIGVVASQSGGGSNTPCDQVKTGGSKEPQMKGKTCAQTTKNDCLFVHDAIQCCDECKDPENRTPAPAQNNNQNTGPKKKKGCFSGVDHVQTKEYGRITMSELAERRDAHVLTRNDEGELEYSNVRYWLHAQPSVNMKFVVLRTESGHRLPITSDHLIYETDCNGGDGHAIFAKNVRVDRCLYVNENGKLKETRVMKKDEEKMIGIYSPITSTGSIVVNDVLASCYNYYENESLQKFIYQYMIGFQDALASWLPTSIHQAAFNSQNGAMVAVPRLILNFLQLSKYFVH